MKNIYLIINNKTSNHKKNVKNVYWMYCVKIPNLNSIKRKKLLKKLNQKGIETREMFIPYNLQNFCLKTIKK